MKVDLIFLTDVLYLKYIASNSSEMLKIMTPITSNMAVAFELEEMGIEYIDEWNFLKYEDIQNNKNVAHNLAENWWDEALASTNYNGFALADAAKQDLIFFFEASLNARTIYGGLFEAYAVRDIYGHFSPPVPVIRTGPSPASKAAQSVGYAVMFYMAEKRGIAIHHLNFNQGSSI